MKQFLTLFIMTCVWAQNTYSQNISLENSDISVEIKYASDSKDTVLIVLKNTTKKIALISMIDGINSDGKYLGIGLYSSVLPYMPNLLSKYSRELKLTVIRPNDSIVFHQKARINLLDGLNFNLDYMLQERKMEVKTAEFAIVDRTDYDKNVSFLKLKVKQ